MLIHTDIVEDCSLIMLMFVNEYQAFFVGKVSPLCYDIVNKAIINRV